MGNPGLPAVNDPNAINHQKLIDRDRGEVRRFLRIVRKIHKSKKPIQEITIAHLATQQCCFKQRWSDTQRAVMVEFYEKGKL